jgi:hypothetical protein
MSRNILQLYSLKPTENIKPKTQRGLVFAILINPSSMTLTIGSVVKLDPHTAGIYAVSGICLRQQKNVLRAV